MLDATAGKFARWICEYEFEDKEPSDKMAEKDSFYWCNLFEILTEVKEAERRGKSLKKFNMRSEHFTFYDTYYKAIKLLSGEKRGVFLKAICDYMFRGEEPSFEDKEMIGYFNLCRRKMDVSKKRKSSGSKGGTNRRRDFSIVEIN